MGCRVSKTITTTSSLPAAAAAGNTSGEIMARRNSAETNIDNKSRLERKLCLAKDTPEPDFDISDCALKDVPSGVFILCRVLRKDNLDLSKNKLHSLNGGGFIGDLLLLRTLDLRYNKFKKLPDDIYKLENLRELYLSNNELTTLPNTINRLSHLELLDCAYNRLTEIDEINCMPHLRILNLSGNLQLTKLPMELTTCDSLIDIILDDNMCIYPPPEIIELGTVYILQYLQTGDISSILDANDGDMGQPTVRHKLQPNNNNNNNNIKTVTDTFLTSERGGKIAKSYDIDKYSRERMLMEQERLALEKNSMLEAELHNQQQKRKQELLNQLLQQQTESDYLVNKLQLERDTERNKLINVILKAEEDSAMIVDKLISLRNGQDPALIEQERIEQEYILEQLRIKDCDLRKQEILSAMTDILSDEAQKLVMYQEQRDVSSRDILEREHQANLLLTSIFETNDKDRSMVVGQIMQDEELQKSAVISLISKNDSRTWGLVEQVRIVESQLAAMTVFEIERKKLDVDEQLSDLSSRRLNLTYVLLDLLDQQEKRKAQLLDTLTNIENQKQNEQNFWLLQYQKLLDSQPIELSTKSNGIDPLLGYNFLVNGVVHCLPFLSKIWQNQDIDLCDINDMHLQEAGVKNVKDRLAILKSITEFLCGNVEGKQSSSKSIATAKQNNKNETTDEYVQQDDLENIDDVTRALNMEPKSDLSECVICMEDSCKIIFLPCGHLCCCNKCHIDLKLCPMCRTEIDRRIKVIQC